MKYKYIYTSDKLLIEDDCISFLEEMSKQGWKLKRVFFSLFIFEKCDTRFKYQLDYSDYDKEYVEVIEDLGYEYICLFKEIKFYCHKDLNAMDLQTDSIIYNSNITKRYKGHIFIDLLYILLLFLFICKDYGYSLREKMPADFYIQFNKEVMLWIFYVLIIYFMLQIIKKIDIIYKIKHNNFNQNSLICFHSMFRFLKSITLITIICLIVFLLYFFIKPLLFIGMFFTGLFLTDINQMISENQKYTLKKDSKKKRITMRILSYSLCIISCFLVIFPHIANDRFLFMSYSDINPYYQYNDLKSDKESNLFLTQIKFCEEFSYDSTLKIDNYHNEIYYNIKDKKIAQIIFEQILIDNEFLTNETRIEEANKSIEERKETTHKSYNQAKQHYNQYETSFADICYYYKDQLIAIKDKQIVICTLDNPNEINSILKHYFK